MRKCTHQISGTKHILCCSLFGTKYLHVMNITGTQRKILGRTNGDGATNNRNERTDTFTLPVVLPYTVYQLHPYLGIKSTIETVGILEINCCRVGYLLNSNRFASLLLRLYLEYTCKYTIILTDGSDGILYPSQTLVFMKFRRR